MRQSLGIYIHIPFCASKCGYCDFYSLAGCEALIPSYHDALLEHLDIDFITYHYQVEDAEGKILRREWSLVPRHYHFDSSKNYVFNDQWQDRPLCAHLYSNAYLTTRHARHDEQVEARRVPLYRRTVVFRVSAPQLTLGQSVALLGSHPMIGSWSTARYLRMDYIGQGDWLLTAPSAKNWPTARCAYCTVGCCD